MACRGFGAHVLNQCWLVVNWTLTNKLHWNLNQNPMVFVEVKTFETVFCKLATIFSRLQSANRDVHGCRYMGCNWWRTDCWDHSKVPIMISITIGYSPLIVDMKAPLLAILLLINLRCVLIYDTAIHHQSPWKEAVPVSILHVDDETCRDLVLDLRIGALVC